MTLKLKLQVLKMKPEIVSCNMTKLKFRKCRSNASDVVLKSEVSVHAKEFTVPWGKFFSDYTPVENELPKSPEMVDDTELINEGWN